MAEHSPLENRNHIARLSLKTLLVIIFVIASFFGGWIWREKTLFAHSMGNSLNTGTTGVVARVKELGPNVFAALSLGADDGLNTGHACIVYRDEKLIATMVVTKVESNISVAKVVDFANPNDELKEGDVIQVPNQQPNREG